MDKYISAAKEASPEELNDMMERLLAAMRENHRVEKVRRANRRIRRGGGRPELRVTRQLASTLNYRVHLEFV